MSAEETIVVNAISKFDYSGNSTKILPIEDSMTIGITKGIINQRRRVRNTLWQKIIGTNKRTTKTVDLSLPRPEYSSR